MKLSSWLIDLGRSVQDPYIYEFEKRAVGEDEAEEGPARVFVIGVISQILIPLGPAAARQLLLQNLGLLPD